MWLSSGFTLVLYGRLLLLNHNPTDYRPGNFAGIICHGTDVAIGEADVAVGDADADMAVATQNTCVLI